MGYHSGVGLVTRLQTSWEEIDHLRAKLLGELNKPKFLAVVADSKDHSTQSPVHT